MQKAGMKQAAIEKDALEVDGITYDKLVFARNMYKYGAEWTGTDLAENQIEQAKITGTTMR